MITVAYRENIIHYTMLFFAGDKHPLEVLFGGHGEVHSVVGGDARLGMLHTMMAMVDFQGVGQRNRVLEYV